MSDTTTADPRPMILTSDRPTSLLALGHVFDSLHNRVAFKGGHDQHSQERFVLIANAQAPTDDSRASPAVSSTSPGQSPLLESIRP